MAHRVQLALYDLSRGMAKAMSMAILGKQIDGKTMAPTLNATLDSSVPSVRRSSFRSFEKDLSADIYR